jgi:hypothetical protein
MHMHLDVAAARNPMGPPHDQPRMPVAYPAGDAMTAAKLLAICGEREWLASLVEESGRALPIEDAGISLPDLTADFVYEIDGHRYEVTVKEVGQP